MTYQLIVGMRPEPEQRTDASYLLDLQKRHQEWLYKQLAGGGVVNALARSDVIERIVRDTEGGARGPIFYELSGEPHLIDKVERRSKKNNTIVAAYRKPRHTWMGERLDELLSQTGATPTNSDMPTPDFSDEQHFLNDAPAGVGARSAWSEPGGDGSGVRVIDIEYGWRLSHEDLSGSPDWLLSGEPSTEGRFVEHGTAVLGILSATKNVFGVTGIAPGADLKVVSVQQNPAGCTRCEKTNVAKAVYEAIPHLGAGDILLLEMQDNTTPRGKFIPSEWWPAEYKAIKDTVNLGILVIAAAANGEEDLNHLDYNTPQPGFPADWRNPFDRSKADSGSILIGAGCPPGSLDFQPDLSRFYHSAQYGGSNYGSCLDAQGWGWSIVTTGYGSRWGENTPDRSYMASFGFTSGAASMVAAALACVQGVLRAHRVAPLTPGEARDLLRRTGTPQVDGPGRPVTQRIGNRPDLRQLIDRAKQLRGI